MNEAREHDVLTRIEGDEIHSELREYELLD